MLNTLSEAVSTATNLSATSTIEVIDLNTAGFGKLATGTLTGTGNFSADDSYTLGGTTYIFKAAPSSANEVDLGGDLETSLANLAAAINGTGTAGTTYGTGTVANSQVTATSTATVLTLTAKNTTTYSGAAGNAIAMVEVTDAGTVGTLSGATLAGGTDTNKDVMLFVGLQHTLAAGYDGIAQRNVRLDVEFGDQFQIAPKPTKTVLSKHLEGYGLGRNMKIRYDRRAFGFAGTQELTGHADEVILPPQYINTNLDYTAYVIDFYSETNTMTVQQDFNTRVYILVPATDNSASTTVTSGITESTNASNTLSDLQAILKPWLETSAAGGGAPKLLGDATSTTYFG
jgi:hypothetical protein